MVDGASLVSMFKSPNRVAEFTNTRIWISNKDFVWLRKAN